jgi:pimeloyl-ACP methyl ester carboxylesterase
MHPPRPVLIYLPGLDGTGRLLHRQPALHAAYQVLCASYPQDRPHTYEQLAAAAAQHLEAASGGRPGVVLAESFGGAVGLLLALRRPDLVERLVLVNTFAYFPARWRIRLGALFGRFLPSRPSPPRTRRFRGRYFFSPDIPEAERTAWWERTAGVPMSAFGLRLPLIARLDLRPRLPEIDIPALVLTAPDDRVVPPAAGRELAGLLPRARLLELPVGHAALIHPRIDVDRLLAEPSYWPRPVVATP